MDNRDKLSPDVISLLELASKKNDEETTEEFSMRQHQTLLQVALSKLEICPVEDPGKLVCLSVIRHKINSLKSVNLQSDLEILVTEIEVWKGLASELRESLDTATADLKRDLQRKSRLARLRQAKLENRTREEKMAAL